MTDLLLATTNPGKRREFSRLLAHLPARVVMPDEVGIDLDVEEPHDTYAENARAKADAYARAAGMLTLADDSGLEAAALGWGPGVRTGRFGGPQVTDKVAYLLEQLGDTRDRRARMVCVLAIGIPTDAAPRIEVFSGVMQGLVATRPRGDGGFGYDPVFLLPSGVTTAELPEAEKDRISHRGRAVQAATPRLLELLAAS
ncbi:MAG TPA: non-canonical purine NTP pyrophosphatase [Candidatus Limnocylindria bacterium]|nr:non-canonical purine NTP pyrophosphatase [Candidatus Limnocylindria bacterium]